MSSEPLSPEIVACVKRALEEDIGRGDVTTNSIIPTDAIMSGRIIAKQAGLVAGLDVARAAFQGASRRKTCERSKPDFPVFQL